MGRGGGGGGLCWDYLPDCARDLDIYRVRIRKNGAITANGDKYIISKSSVSQIEFVMTRTYTVIPAFSSSRGS